MFQSQSLSVFCPVLYTMQVLGVEPHTLSVKTITVVHFVVRREGSGMEGRKPTTDCYGS